MKRLVVVGSIAALLFAGCSTGTEDINPGSEGSSTGTSASGQSTGSPEQEPSTPAEVEHLGTGVLTHNWVHLLDSKHFQLVLGLSTDEADIRNSGVTVTMTDEAGQDFVGHSPFDASNPWQFKADDLRGFSVHSVDEKLGYMILEATQIISEETDTTSEETDGVWVAVELKTGKESSRISRKFAPVEGQVGGGDIELLPYVDETGKLALAEPPSRAQERDENLMPYYSAGTFIEEGKVMWQLVSEKGDAKPSEDRNIIYTVIPGAVDTRKTPHEAFPNTGVSAMKVVDGIVVTQTRTKTYAVAADGAIIGSTPICGQGPNESHGELSAKRIGDWLVVGESHAWNPKTGKQVCFDGNNNTKSLPVVGVTDSEKVIVESEGRLLMVDPDSGQTSNLPFDQPLWQLPERVQGAYWLWKFEETLGVMKATELDS